MGITKDYSQVPVREASSARSDSTSTIPTDNTTTASTSDSVLARNHHEEQDASRDPLRSSSSSDDNETSQLQPQPHSQSQQITVDNAMERLGMGPFQFRVLTAAGLCFASDAMQVLILSFLSEVLKLEWNLTSSETALITSILFIGAIFGTLFLGPMADRQGRKPAFLLAATIISVFGFLTGLAINYSMLLAILFVVGFGVGGATVPFDILAEFLPADSRGKNLLYVEYFWTGGVLFVVVMARLTLGVTGGDDGAGGNWRLFVFLCSLPCFSSIFIGYWFVPESPRWLCTTGRCDEALQIIRNATAVNGKDAILLFPEGTTLIAEEEEESNCGELFSIKWRWTTLKLWGTWGAFAFGYYGTIMVITEIFDKEDDPSDGGKASYNFDYAAIFVSSSAELVGTTFAISTVDRVGRVPLQVVSYALAGLCVFSLCLGASREASRHMLMALGFCARIFEMAGSCVSWVSTAEILTTDVRTTGHSAANAVARIGSLSAPFLVEGDYSYLNKGLVMLVIHSITVFCVAFLPETKGRHMGRMYGTEIEDLTLSEEEQGQDENDDEGNGDSLMHVHNNVMT